ncbi:MAG: serine/threonine-protein kinase [Planctomycetota bacterium]
MTFLDDGALSSLRRAAGEPDLSNTKYELIQHIACGGMSSVYLAFDRELQRNVALKVSDAADVDGGIAERMLREAQIVAKLEHPGIVAIHDVGTLPDQRSFCVMKFVEGQTLDQHFVNQYNKNQHNLNGASFREAIGILKKVCEAVAFAHSRGVLHRDLKPQNIIVGVYGEVVVLDWGVACETRPNEIIGEKVDINIDANKMIVGTPGYMSPEQALGETNQINEQSDIYQLGAVLYFIITGKAAGIGETLIFPSGAARRIRAICKKALSARQQDRYKTAAELAMDLQNFLDGQPVLAYRETWFERMLLWIDRNRFLVGIVAAYLLMRVSILLFFDK